MYVRGVHYKGIAMHRPHVMISQKTGSLHRFPDLPPRDDMENLFVLNLDGHIARLRRHLGLCHTVASDIPMEWYPKQLKDYLKPDILVAFDVDIGLVDHFGGYAIDNIGKPPDFVLEVASRHTARNDVVAKGRMYAEFGIKEYWRFDRTGGLYYPTPISGDRLVSGEYSPIDVVSLGPRHLHGASDALGLHLCWEDGFLNWWNPITESYLPGFDDMDKARLSAEARADTAEARADDERRGRITAEAKVRELQAELDLRMERG